MIFGKVILYPRPKGCLALLEGQAEYTYKLNIALQLCLATQMRVWRGHRNCVVYGLFHPICPLFRFVLCK